MEEKKAVIKTWFLLLYSIHLTGLQGFFDVKKNISILITPHVARVGRRYVPARKMSFFSYSYASVFELFHSFLYKSGRGGAIFHIFIFLSSFLKRYAQRALRPLVTYFLTTIIFLPFLLQTKNISTRTYIFPVLVSRAKRLRYSLQFLTRLTRRPRFLLSFTMRYALLWMDLIFHYESSEYLQHTQTLLATGLDNRSYIHYRWR
jgi:hypothetical protein